MLPPDLEEVLQGERPTAVVCAASHVGGVATRPAPLRERQGRSLPRRSSYATAHSATRVGGGVIPTHDL